MIKIFGGVSHLAKGFSFTTLSWTNCRVFYILAFSAFSEVVTRPSCYYFDTNVAYCCKFIFLIHILIEIVFNKRLSFLKRNKWIYFWILKLNVYLPVARSWERFCSAICNHNSNKNSSGEYLSFSVSLIYVILRGFCFNDVADYFYLYWFKLSLSNKECLNYYSENL
jgi:hypothetical protein